MLLTHGTVGPGAGFHVHGTAEFIEDGAIYNQMKMEMPFLTRILQINVLSIEQKI
ncbi:hypothetical protein [Enterococcus devriesei]|uniref:hypothetical protein n=1 Tax=Enterococcus devriesei TaxID=319970 RepID=UPI0028AC580F|nr:hypothetical protein [Enterococcus devriesei]